MSIDGGTPALLTAPSCGDRSKISYMRSFTTPGQRQGDMLRLPWSAYDGTYISLTQSKTGASVINPVVNRLKIEPSATPRAEGDRGNRTALAWGSIAKR